MLHSTLTGLSKVYGLLSTHVSFYPNNVLTISSSDFLSLFRQCSAVRTLSLCSDSIRLFVRSIHLIFTIVVVTVSTHFLFLLSDSIFYSLELFKKLFSPGDRALLFHSCSGHTWCPKDGLCWSRGTCWNLDWGYRNNFLGFLHWFFCRKLR